MKRASYFVFVAFVTLLGACVGAGGPAAAGNTLVFAERESRQCESDGITPEASAQTLRAAGIDVLQSTCGSRTGVAFAAVCGGRTGEILIHRIRAVDVAEAQALGYFEVETLVDAAAGTNYVVVDCASRAPIPTAP
jgi:hypothetical protein